MRGDLVNDIPEFGLIKDLILREKVINLWMKALEQGGWQVKDLHNMPFTLLIDPCPASMLEHIRGVTRVALASAEALNDVYKGKIKINTDYLIAGALLHDIGKLLEYSKKDGSFVKSELGKLIRHPISGVALCYESNLPNEILHIIASHSWEGDKTKRTIESIIIHHADFINFEQFK